MDTTDDLFDMQRVQLSGRCMSKRLQCATCSIDRTLHVKVIVTPKGEPPKGEHIKAYDREKFWKLIQILFMGKLFFSP